MAHFGRSWAFDFSVGISSGWCRGDDGGKAPPFVEKIADIEVEMVVKAGDVMG